LTRTRSLTRKSNYLLVPAVIAFAAMMAALMALPRQAGAATALSFPSTSGSTWQILAGYNTATHSVADGNDPYAIDLQRTDAPTDGSPLLAPVSGTIQFVDSSCIGIRDANRTSILMCHVFSPQSLRNTTVSRGQQIGTVAPAGQANNNGVAHIHLALSAPDTRAPMPFVGQYALEGTQLPAVTTSNGYAGTTFRSTIQPAPLSTRA
jgi:hypothetical protein